MVDLDIEQKNVELEKRNAELETLISKYKLQLDVAKMENDYMKKNMKAKYKELKRIKSKKVYKLYRVFVKIKNKICFWRKEKVEENSTNS